MFRHSSREAPSLYEVATGYYINGNTHGNRFSPGFSAISANYIRYQVLFIGNDCTFESYNVKTQDAVASLARFAIFTTHRGIPFRLIPETEVEADISVFGELVIPKVFSLRKGHYFLAFIVNVNRNMSRFLNADSLFAIDFTLSVTRFVENWAYGALPPLATPTGDEGTVPVINLLCSG
jgi:hypothetical protein